MVLAVRAGLALVGSDLEARRDVCVWVDEGHIESIESQSSCPRHYVGGPTSVILPQPANAHVHSADHIYPEYGIDLHLEELVAPPSGLKHKLLSSTSPDQLVEAARSFYLQAWRVGTGLLVDFRELGGLGCSTAKRALKRVPGGMEVLVLGRPGPRWPEGCDGLGISSPLDYGGDTLARLVASFRPAMAHVGETLDSRVRGDLELALRYRLDGVIHGVYLERGDLEALRDAGIGLVLCVRSNMWHGIGVPPLSDIFESRVRTGIGTDNASWIPPDPWEEARVLMLMARLKGIRGAAKWILRSLFVGGYLIVGRRPKLVEEGDSAYFLVFKGVEPRPSSLTDIYYWILKRVGTHLLVGRVDGGRFHGLGLS